jgi:HK97 family phage portal protein
VRILGLEIARAKPAPAAELRDLTGAAVFGSSWDFFQALGQGQVELPAVTPETAMGVPAVFAAIAFLSRTLAALPLHSYRQNGDSSEKLTGKLQTLIHDAPNPDWTAFKARQYFWQQVFHRGRGLFWIERNAGGDPAALWPMNVARTQVKMNAGRRSYVLDGRDYPSADVIDVPFMLRDDQCGSWAPIQRCAQAIQLSLAMQIYAATFFAGGGVPPLALCGPLPAGPDAQNRALADVRQAIDNARRHGSPITPMPPGYTLTPIGIDPDKGQMKEGRAFQVQEIARAFQLPPVFLQDLSTGTFSNTEQQDLFFVKHLVGQWAQALEQEMNLKLFGQLNGRRYVEHNLDGLQRGDFKTRIEGLARAIQTAQMTPNEARALENRPAHSNPAADELLIQGATVVLGDAPAAVPPANTDPNTTDPTSGGGE